MKIETTYQNLRDAAKAVLNWKFLVLNIYMGGGGRFQIKNVTLSQRELGKKKHTHTLSQKLAHESN